MTTNGNADKWVVFDLIGVLAEPSWREIAEGDPDVWLRFKCGELSEGEFWDDGVGRAYRKMLNFREDRLDLVRKLKGRGYKICVATNFSGEWLKELLAKSQQEGLFDGKVVSGEIGIPKPSKEFWDVVRRYAPVGTVVVDDQHENCEAARSAGYKAVWAHPACDLEHELGGLLAA